ncbi:hypothetical protein COCON_G00018610 [Conger conger]|uniref:Ig-like domain-containing protein n=1 Tax=Conger conger TaxID=82655 RepID=A0A9Q1E3Z9_CONCO|nr:hypothetical protein COCON_G00018610 [Conger conger]
MGGCGRAWWLLGLALQWAWLCCCMTVKFQSDLPLSVALNHKLVLEAHINKTCQEKYTITVLDQHGIEAKASRIVRESEGGPNVSIPLLCEVSRDSEPWDTPEFKWLMDGEEVNNTSSRLSDDGSKLYPASACVRNYTCIASNRLGTNSHQFLNTGGGRMGGCGRAWWLLGLALQWAWLCSCMTVKFQSDLPLSVVLNHKLVLEAHINKTSQEKVGRVEWTRENGQGLVQLPTPKDSPMKFEVPNVTKKDYGEYTITVVDPDGGEAKASRIVRESEGRPNMSIPLLCEVSRDSEPWDTPEFKWLKDGEEVNNTSGRLSDDGSKLYPASACVHNYTCIAYNRLGSNSHQFLNTGCDSSADNQTECTAPWVLFWVFGLLFLGLLVAGLVYLGFRRNRDGQGNGVL